MLRLSAEVTSRAGETELLGRLMVARFMISPACSMQSEADLPSAEDHYHSFPRTASFSLGHSVP